MGSTRMSTTNNSMMSNIVQLSRRLRRKIQSKSVNIMSRYHSRNSVSPQIYALNRSLVAGEKRVSLPANSRKYHL